MKIVSLIKQHNVIFWKHFLWFWKKSCGYQKCNEIKISFILKKLPFSSVLCNKFFHDLTAQLPLKMLKIVISEIRWYVKRGALFNLTMHAALRLTSKQYNAVDTVSRGLASSSFLLVKREMKVPRQLKMLVPARLLVIYAKSSTSSFLVVMVFFTIIK